MNEIFQGKGASSCDGDLSTISTVHNILFSEGMPDKLEEDTSLLKMITLDFEPKLDVDYGYMRKYRTKSIETFYKKEMISATFICFLSVLIWFEYISVFREKDVYWSLSENKINETYSELEAAPCYSSKCFMNEAYDFK